MRLDHVCIAVKSIDAAVAKLAPLLGYRQRTQRVTNTRQKVNVLFLSKPGSLDLKLIEPSCDDSPLWASLRKGEGLHHLCFRTGDMSGTLDELVAKGMRMLSPPAPGEAFGDHLIAFGYAGCGLNVELIDTDERRGLLSTAEPQPDDLSEPDSGR
jgi:methylmalonyl-CoA/ethylmalonyl-CoA epimerase